MYRSLLVPLDGSVLGEQALPLALAIARRAGASVQLVHVHVPYVLMYADSMSPLDATADTEARDQERRYLDTVAQRLKQASPVPAEVTLLESLPVAEAIEEHAVKTGADLIVMTTHGYGPLTRLWLGSVADELVRRATVPVLLVRPREGAADFAAEPRVRHALIPLDGSPESEGVLGPAVELGRLMQADCILLQVVGLPAGANLDPVNYATWGALEPSLGQRRREAEAYLGGVAARLRAEGLTVQTRVAVGKQPAVGILNEARERGADLIALETHGRRGLERLLLGSVADKVVRGASVPVLVHRSPGNKQG